VFVFDHRRAAVCCARCCACWAQVNFEQDAVISQMNEYEVLQLLMGECRESLAAYKTSLEEDTKIAQVGQRTASSAAAVGLCVAVWW
jgi:histone-lysine N-methyltransferase SETD3